VVYEVDDVDRWAESHEYGWAAYYLWHTIGIMDGRHTIIGGIAVKTASSSLVPVHTPLTFQHRTGNDDRESTTRIQIHAN
jgi:hypothetical protein